MLAHISTLLDRPVVASYARALGCGELSEQLVGAGVAAVAQVGRLSVVGVCGACDGDDR